MSYFIHTLTLCMFNSYAAQLRPLKSIRLYLQ